MFEPRTMTITNTLTRAEQNRQNAAHSTGPRTDLGKSISKLNAVKTGLTGRTVLLPTDDAARYEQHVQNWVTELKPEGPRECALAQSIADAYWRAERIVRIEFALYAEGAAAAGSQCEATAGETREQYELETYLRHERQLRNLSVQEGRLRRSREKDLKELRELQKERFEATAAVAAPHTLSATPAVSASQSTTASTVKNSSPQYAGFVFTTAGTQEANGSGTKECNGVSSAPQGK